MNCTAFHAQDVEFFLTLATAEGWLAEAWEFDFILSVFPAGCFCVRDQAGIPVGFVTALRHDRSGWIGNLIVAASYRGSGAGEKLFIRALAALQDDGVESVWLTASKMGKSLYEKHGFAAVDTIRRWTATGNGSAAGRNVCESVPDVGLDQMGWDDRREGLLKAVSQRGSLLSSGSAIAVIQPCGRALQIGPFAALDAKQAAQILDYALAEIPDGVTVYIDTPAGNPVMTRLLQERGFRMQGSNELMYAGRKPDYRPEYVYALATMGSCG